MRIMMFCSNPVNGGTARVFYDLYDQFAKNRVLQDEVHACVNDGNTVEIYDLIKDLDRLPIFSEQEICGELYGGSLIARIIKRLIRKIRYAPIKNKNIKVMEQYLKKNHFDCVIIHNGGYVGDDLCNQMLTAAYRCKKFVTRRIFVLHNDVEKNTFLKLRFYGYDKKISKEATNLVTVSQYTRNRLVRSSFITKKIQVIYNGLSEKNSLSLEQKLKSIPIERSVKNILMLGNFQNNKGQLKFTEVAKHISEKILNVHFYYIGNVYDEEYYSKCMAEIYNNGLKEVSSVICGLNNAAEYMDLFDVVAVPSLYDESFGLIAVEAMAKRVPVVAFACGGIPEVVDNNETGFVVPIGDVSSMAEKIAWLLEHDEERGRMGQNGRGRYEDRFTVDVMYQEYIHLLEDND